jgi:hypothetical protein
VAASKYKKLFEPFSIGKVHLKNRIVKTAAQTYFFDSGAHRVSSLAKAFYEAIAMQRRNEPTGWSYPRAVNPLKCINMISVVHIYTLLLIFADLCKL